MVVLNKQRNRWRANEKCLKIDTDSPDYHLLDDVCYSMTSASLIFFGAIKPTAVNNAFP